MKEISLKYRIILGGIIVILIPFIISGIITYKRISNSLEQIAREKSTQIAMDLSNLLQMSSMEEIKFMTSVAMNSSIIEAVSTDNFALADATLSHLYKSLGSEYEDFFLTDKNGIVCGIASDKTRKGIDISDREYFKDAIKGKASISIPVISKATGKLIMVVSVPVYSKSGKFAGIAGGPLNIDFMIKNISSIKIGNTGYPFIVDHRGVVIVHQDKTHILTTNMYEIQGSLKITRRMMNNETGSEEYIYNGIKKIAGFAPVPFTGWKVVVTQNRDEIFAPSKSVLFFIIFSGFIFMAIVATGIVFISRKISGSVENTIKILREITEHTNEVVLTIDLDKRISWANSIIENITGISSRDLKGREPVLTNLNNIPVDEIWSLLDSGNAWTGRIILKDIKNEDVTLEAMILPVKNDNGTIYSYIEIGRNITHELMIENRMRQAQKIEAVGTLAGGIAHDFNNILAGIFGYAQISLTNLDDKSRTKKNIEEILKAAERARDLVQQILTFSRKSDIEFKPVNIASVIKEAMILLRASIPSTVELHESINSDAYIMGDRIQIHQIIINLCTNASHAIENSRGVINVSLNDLFADKEFVRFHPGLLEGPHVQLTVTDSGKGMNPEIIEQIFDPFFTTKPQGKGTGLGLSVVHGIIQKLNGIINVYSEPGKGTTFSVILPVSTDIKYRSEHEDKEKTINGGTEKILLIDDETTIINSFQPGLENIGYKVKSFSDSLHALDNFRSNPYLYDIIITDQTMPRMTGIDLTNEIRKLREDIPVILSSGYIDRNIEEISRKAGISGIIRKPATLYDIASAIRKALDKKA